MAITELKTKQSNLFTLDRCTAVPSIIGDSSEFLIIAGLSGTAKDIGHLTEESPNAFLLGGAMGAAVTMALGLALSQTCLLYTSPSPRDATLSRMPSSA